ncbi:MAG: fatty acyl-AMP ligase, partial [Cyanobacteria bacterium P01_A01_bin.135]
MTQGTSGRITHKHLAEPQDHLIGILQWRAIHQPQQLAYRFLDTAGEGVELGQGKAWNYAELSRRVEAIARQLSSFAGRPVMLAYPAGLDFVAAFFGCLQAGAIAVPVPVPGRHQGLERWWHIFMDVQPHAVLTTQQHGQIQADSADIARAIPHRVTWIVADDPENAPNPVGDRPSFKNLDLDSPALLQYTSGSTRQPRGVIISHRNLMHNLGVIHQRFGHSPDSQGVIWLPPHHDMGLIGGILAPLYGGFPVTLMSPTAFLRQPLRWLQAISAFGGSGGVTSGGPNFAYERCLEKVTAEQRRSLDLSHWDLAFTGAEPVQAKTLIRFADAFADCGFRTSAFHPCYGLAEATLFVSGGAKQEAPAVAKLDRRAIARNRAVESAAPDALPVVSCGQPAADGELLIVDPEMRQPCNSEQIGEIWLTGPSVAQGYWQQPEMTQETFKGYLADGSGPFLRTGDLGFLQQGQLFVTGRLKDLIIIRGQNHYPQDIEQTVAQSHDAVRSQPGATFGLAVDGEERLVVVQEVQRTALRSLETAKVVEAIRAAVS